MAEAEPEQSEIDRLLDKTELEFMLEFETQIFLDIIHKDGLVVAAKGLNLDLVLLNLFKVYSDPGNLVLVLNSLEAEENYFINKLNDKNIHKFSQTTSSDERQDIYLEGGIHFVTTRILVIDMLKKRVPIEKITGFIVLRAHRIMESCQEAFVLRLFRQANKTGFVKAFSNSVQSFTMGFGQVERVMRALFVKELYIWPRFHSTVIQSLKPHEPKVIELHIPISANMNKLQSYILELLNLSIKVLKRINKTTELQEITVENCLIQKYHKILQLQLDGIWNQLSTKSKQLVADLKTLRHLMNLIFYADPVTFYDTLSKYRTMEYAQTATWVLYEPAEMLFTQAHSLIFTGNKELNPELSPKWKSLLELLKVEIPNEIRSRNLKETKILILCSDHKTCFQLNQVLTQGPHSYLFIMALKYGISFKSLDKTFENCGKNVNTTTEDIPKKKAKVDANEKTEAKDADVEEFKSNYLLTMSQLTPDAGTSDEDIVFESFEELENLNLTQICESLTVPTIIIQTFKGTPGSMNLQRSLDELKPSFIIMYHSNLTAIREIETYEAHRRQNTLLNVYFLIHTETVEEQAYLTSMRREKEAFEHLIATKSTMVVPEDQDGKSDTCQALQRELKSPTKSTRQGGSKTEESTRKFIIVDMREFRSELPALIHKRGIEIEPIVITVGDYILTRDICIERKSLSDLIQSLNSGRLYQQSTQMSRYYSKPMLLIEFDQNKPFSWQSTYMLSKDTDDFYVQKKLLLLTLHFPKLKLIWSPSPYASAQLFEELKDGKDEPNIEYATAIGSEQDLDVIEAKYNTGIYDFVQKLPGINAKNIDVFLRHVKIMNEATEMTEEELKEVLGNANDAKAFYAVLHANISEEKDTKTNQKSNKFQGKKFTRKK